jgi:hypothetical protein
MISWQTTTATTEDIYFPYLIPAELKGIYSSSLEQHNVKAKVLKAENAHSTTI